MFLAFVLAHLDALRRIELLEFQQQLLSDEHINLLRSGNDQQKHGLATKVYKRLERRSNLLRILSFDRLSKVMSELDELRILVDNNPYLDRIGRPDFALESAGGRILSIGNTQLASPHACGVLARLMSYVGIVPSDQAVNSPRYVIQPSLQPGECFAFVGPGEIVIKLVRPVFIDSVGIEHIQPQMSPDGQITNAPNEFSVYGVNDDSDHQSMHLGTFRYDISMRQPLQLFQLDKQLTTKSYSVVRFEINSNHGDLNNTCVYRIRVHGSLIPLN